MRVIMPWRVQRDVCDLTTKDLNEVYIKSDLQMKKTLGKESETGVPIYEGSFQK